MENLQLPEVIQQWANLVLVWVGFGTLVGLLAKAVMPGRDPGGAVATVLMGMGGAVIGCGILAFFVPAMRVKPISVIGFVVATAGAFILLFFYRLLGGYLFMEGEGFRRRPYVLSRRASRRLRRVDSALIED